MTSKPAGKRPRYLIVGGGIAGCSLAYVLGQAGLEVRLIEAGEIGETGASSVPMALMNPHRGRTARASELDLAGLHAMQELDQDLRAQGLDAGIHWTGVLRIASNEKQRKKWAKLTVQQLEPSEISSAYHAPFGGIFSAEAGWLEPDKLLRALKQAAEAKGVQFFENVRVQTLETGFKLETTAGIEEADKVIFCTGASENRGFDLPEFEPMAGDVIALEANITMPYPIAGAIYGMQNKGLIYMGGNHRERLEPEAEDIERLKESSSWFLKDLKDSAITQVWSGIRAKSADNKPLLTELHPNLWFFGALGGRGFLCSYHLANVLAKKLVTGELITESEDLV